MTPRLRRIEDADVERVLALNHTHVAVLSPMDADRLADLRSWSRRADVLEVPTATGSWEVAGFVLVLGPGTAYDAAKYRWFSDHFGGRGEHFAYLDRIVIDTRFHRRGLGGFAYDELERDVATYGRMCLEVDLEPPNVASLAFHAARGYVEVARTGEPGEQVSMQVKELGDHAGRPRHG